MIRAGLLAGIVLAFGSGCSGTAHVPDNSDGSTAGDAAAGDDALPDAGPPSDGAPQGEGGVSDAMAPDAAPPFSCSQASTTSPVLDGILVLDPADPHPGDTVTVIVKSNALGRDEAPPMDLLETWSGGTRTWTVNNMAGGAAHYYYAIPNVELGDHCLLGRISGSDEIAGKFTVTPRPPGPALCHGGVFKVTENHQWTCSEQPEWGNELWIYTYDAQGDPLPNVTVRIDWPATTERPLHNDTDPPTPSDVPPTVQTDGSGVFHGYNYWPTNQIGYMVFLFTVDGCASDVATEITTGWWETDNYGCRFCDPSFTHRNVWGHWSYTIVFQVDSAATEACVVPNDHAGQSGCAIEHIHHDPVTNACWPSP